MMWRSKGLWRGISGWSATQGAGWELIVEAGPVPARAARTSRAQGVNTCWCIGSHCTCRRPRPRGRGTVADQEPLTGFADLFVSYQWFYPRHVDKMAARQEECPHHNASECKLSAPSAGMAARRACEGGELS